MYNSAQQSVSAVENKEVVQIKEVKGLGNYATNLKYSTGSNYQQLSAPVVHQFAAPITHQLSAPKYNREPAPVKDLTHVQENLEQVSNSRKYIAPALRNLVEPIIAAEQPKLEAYDNQDFFKSFTSDNSY